MYLTDAGRWATLDPLAATQLLCTRPADAVLAHCPPKEPLLYVVGLGNGGTLTDVTARYVTDFGACSASSTDSNWWQQALVACAAAHGAKELADHGHGERGAGCAR